MNHRNETLAYRLMVWALLLLLAAQVAPAQALFRVREQAWPGSTLAARGDGLDGLTKWSVYPYAADGTRGAAQPLPMLGTNGQVAVLRLPSTLANGVYEIAAATRKGPTNSMFVNRPRLQWLDVDAAQPGQKVRIVGRNLRPLPSKAPVVTLTLSSGATAVCPQTLTSDDVIEVTVPAGLAPGSYSLDVQNGLTTGSASRSPDSLPLSVVAQTSDPFGLGVSWCGEFAAAAANVHLATGGDPYLSAVPVGVPTDGTSDVSDALAIALARVGGSGAGRATLRLPAGDFYVDKDNAVVVYGGIVLQGAGKGLTRLHVGRRWTPSNPPDGDYAIRMWGGGGANAGICDLTIVNDSTSPIPNRVLGGGPSEQTVVRSFLKNVEVRLGNGYEATLFHPRQFVIDGCGFASTATTKGPLLITDSIGLRFTGNALTYRNGRFTLDFAQRLVVEGNVVSVDNAYRTPGSVETGGLQTSVDRQALIRDNTIQAINGHATKPDGDGEMIMSQLNNTDGAFVGGVKSAPGRVVVPAAAWGSTDWVSNTAASGIPRSLVTIIKGKGAGQYRWATSWTKGSLQVDRPWQVAPDATSTYSVASTSSYQQTIVDNRISGSCQAMSIYDGDVDGVIRRNSIHNSGGIYLRAEDISVSKIGNGWQANGSNVVMYKILDLYVEGNGLLNDDGYRGAYIAHDTQDEDGGDNHQTGGRYGTATFGLEICNNSIVGSMTPAKQSLGSFFGDGVILNTALFHPGAYDPLLSLGTIVEGNALTNTLGVQLPSARPALAELGNRAVTYPLAPVSATTTSN